MHLFHFTQKKLFIKGFHSIIGAYRNNTSQYSNIMRTKGSKLAVTHAYHMELTLVAVTVSPADGPGALSEEAPGVGLSVWVPAVAVVP